ncbi:MAG TPA: uL15 family ribosomal protein [Candidatus Bathyarchaeia archaeon]
MPHKLRRIRKTRGSRTQGYGRIGQHRKSGSKGFRKAGRHKHLWSYVSTYEPNYFGKHGFTSPQSLKRNVSIINITRLNAIVTKLPATEEQEPQIIDLTSLGFAKLLGTGKITKPLTVKVSSCSKSAAKKIAQAGGKVLTSSEDSGE